MKKQISLIIALIMMLGNVSLFAQKPFAGTITYSMSADGTDDVNIISQLATQKQQVIVKGNNSKTVIVADAGIGIISISNGDYKFHWDIFDFSSVGMGKYYMELDEAKLKEKFETTKFDFDYQSETKTIIGKTCKKTILTITDLESDEQNTVVLWVTDDLMLGDNVNFANYPGLKGYPMRMEIKQEDESGTHYTIVMEASQLTPDKKLKDAAFMLPSEAIPVKDAPEEVKSMLGVE